MWTLQWQHLTQIASFNSEGTPSNSHNCHFHLVLTLCGFFFTRRPYFVHHGAFYFSTSLWCLLLLQHRLQQLRYRGVIGPLWLTAGLELMQKQQFTAMTRQIRVCLFSLWEARLLLMPRAQTPSGTLQIFRKQDLHWYQAVKTDLNISKSIQSKICKPSPVEFTSPNWPLVVLNTEPDLCMSQLITTLFNVVSLYWDLWEELDFPKTAFTPISYLINSLNFFGELEKCCICPKRSPTPP